MGAPLLPDFAKIRNDAIRAANVFSSGGSSTQPSLSPSPLPGFAPLTKRGNIKRSGFTAEEFEGIIANLGLESPTQESAGLLPSLFGILNSFNFAVAGAVEEVFNPLNGTGSVVGRVLGELYEIPRLAAGLFGVSLEASRFAQREGFAAIMEQGGIGPGGSLSSILPFMYSKDGAGWRLQEDGVVDVTIRGFTGLALDIAFDPITYLGGVGAFSKGAAKVSRLGVKAIESAGIKVPKKGRLITALGKHETEEMAKRMLRKSDALQKSRSATGLALNKRRNIMSGHAQLTDPSALAEALKKDTLALHFSERRILKRLMKLTEGLTLKQAKDLLKYFKVLSPSTSYMNIGAGGIHNRSLEAIASRAAHIRVMSGRAGLDIDIVSRDIRGMEWMGWLIPGTPAVSKFVGRGKSAAVGKLSKQAENFLRFSSQFDGQLGALMRSSISLPRSISKMFQRFPNLVDHPEAVRIAQGTRDTERFRNNQAGRMLQELFEEPFRKVTGFFRGIDNKLKRKVHQAIIRHIDDPTNPKFSRDTIPQIYRHLISWHRAIMNDMTTREIQHQMIDPLLIKANYHPRSRGFWVNSDQQVSDALRGTGDKGVRAAELLIKKGSIGLHNEERIFKTIQDGIDAGLTPRYDIAANLMARMSASHRAIGGSEFATALRLQFGRDVPADLARAWMQAGGKVSNFIEKHLLKRLPGFTDEGAPKTISLKGEFAKGTDVRNPFGPDVRVVRPHDLSDFSSYSSTGKIADPFMTQAELAVIRLQAQTVGFDTPLTILYNAKLKRAWLSQVDEMKLRVAREGGAKEIPVFVRAAGIDEVPIGVQARSILRKVDGDVTKLSTADREFVEKHLRNKTRLGAHVTHTGGSLTIDNLKHVGLKTRKAEIRARAVIGPSSVREMSDQEFTLLNKMIAHEKERVGAIGDVNFAALGDVGKALFLHQRMQKINGFPSLQKFMEIHGEHFAKLDHESFTKIMAEISDHDYYAQLRKEGWEQFGKKSVETIKRRLGRKRTKKGHLPLIKALDKLRGMYLPRGVIDELTEANHFVFPKDFGNILTTVDLLNNVFKMGVTLPWPSFHFRNFYSNIMQSFLDLGFASLNVVKHAENWKIWNGADGMLKVKYGPDIPYQAVLDMGQRTGILISHSDLIEISIRPGPKPFRRKGLIHKMRSTASAIENDARMAHFIEGLRNGLDWQQAAERTKKFLFDYGNLNNTERAFFSRIIPFYQWTRFNIPLQVESVILRPGKIAAISKLFGARSAGMDYDLLPDYIRGDMSATVSTGRDENGVTKTFIYGIDAPFSDLERLDTTFGMSRLIRKNLATITPLLKGLIELGTNRELFTNRALSPRVDGFAGSVISSLPAPLQNWLEVQAFVDLDGKKRVVMNPVKSYLLFRGWAYSRLFRSAETLGRDIEDDRIDSWALQFITGVRTREYNFDERTKQRAREKAKKLEQFLIDRGVLHEFKRGFVSEEELDEIFPKAGVIPPGILDGRYMR